MRESSVVWTVAGYYITGYNITCSDGEVCVRPPQYTVFCFCFFFMNDFHLVGRGCVSRTCGKNHFHGVHLLWYVTKKPSNMRAILDCTPISSWPLFMKTFAVGTNDNIIHVGHLFWPVFPSLIVIDYVELIVIPSRSISSFPFHTSHTHTHLHLMPQTPRYNFNNFWWITPESGDIHNGKRRKRRKKRKIKRYTSWITSVDNHPNSGFGPPFTMHRIDVIAGYEMETDRFAARASPTSKVNIKKKKLAISALLLRYRY